MIFKNKKAYIVNRVLENDSNNESYDLVTTNDFIFETTFNLVANKPNEGESCIISREGYNMGVYLYNFNDENFIKWVWWEVDNEKNHIYNEIFVHKKYDLFESTNVKVIKKDKSFNLYVNNEFYETKHIKFDLFDYSDKSMFIGVSNPNNPDGHYGWFNGEIHDIKIYDSCDENIDTLYLWFDFKNSSSTKIFDKSGNKLDGEIYKSDNKTPVVVKELKVKRKTEPNTEKVAYIVDRFTNSKTNTKSYELLKKDFIFEATFTMAPNSSEGLDSCVISREGSMGIFIFNYDGQDFLKWTWREINDNGEVFQNEIFVHDQYDLTLPTKVKVIKKGKNFSLFVNDVLYKKKKITYKLYDYSDSYIFIGAGNPHCINDNHRWFYGDVLDVKVYHSSVEDDENLYLWYDFKKKTSFKVFDKSGNGNHAEIFETQEDKISKSDEFNKLARPAKII
jgi:hypothetical protein